ncbi:MAG: NusG domain II-containing protein [Clostridia bacterium]|nr:NusG domain II-containing protein [Clostridia bacterium]
MKNERKRSWILLICVLVLAGVLFGLFQLLRTKEPGAQVEVLRQGERIGLYDLDEDRDIEILDLCVLSVRGGAVSVQSSYCPRQVCVHHRPVSRNGETIVCLPNHLVIRILGGKDADTDFLL